MAPNSALRERFTADQSSDPRESGGAQIIDLATRNVLPSVTQRKKADGLGLAAGVAIVALLGGLTLWSMDAARNPETKQVVEPVATAPVVPAAAITPAPAPTIVSPNAPPAPLPAPAPQAVLAAQPGTILAPQANTAASPTVVFDAAGGPATAADIAGKNEFKGGNANEDFASRLGGLGGGSASAKRSFDPATTVTQGTLIPAVLETAIDTDVPGFVRAIVSSDVKSFDGRTVLVPRSSRLIGQYKSGLSAGQKRAYVIWTRLIRPDGVSVDLGSPAIAFGGETGLAGKVNGHFFERFGSAMLLSVLGGIPNLIGNNSAVVVGGGSSAASAAVQQGGQVGPTIRVRQGEPIRVFTAKDLDFSKTK
ncbi:type IV secretion system protein VirB10 [Novosphingobium chloroacetimidivorans]|uniref:Type IV secretion system protein VirB10 n=1 Tax=Novosphingobium chloroacetimidivorans TaxID=1428314 RepID=A0A7W7KB08_9SPHN|nr:TrbI/VirB10 family protein [Novosphingobium chloroacetimidivorans]MBB4859495.1 type IV secretion system protein VirB10 [Novosphingobium chloroacetimidivorans]